MEANHGLLSFSNCGEDMFTKTDFNNWGGKISGKISAPPSPPPHILLAVSPPFPMSAMKNINGFHVCIFSKCA